MQALMPYLSSPMLANSAFMTHPVLSWIGVLIVALVIIGCITFGPSIVRYMHIKHL